ncbi:DUF4199 domain-containing protein [Flavobacterium zepuense]|uniref:DUF4199 domain-containing protein n=1 Tax=Flavobacterium zepuense TaxID=2593302 RepID=A0A552V2V9_9FLAO|nr:DUF4199 domain-containing protein [Flavobacterium zepuense]TRW24792.1 DUF4199 domain-containing protein [Flavobacterium zepuense]
MDEKITITPPVKPAKAALSYGVVFGLVLIIEFVVFYALDINPQNGGAIAVVNSLLNYIVLPMIFIFLACNQYKKLSGGYITLAQALKAGVIVTVIAALVLGVFNIIFNMVLPELQAEMLQKAKEGMVAQNPNMTAEQLEMGIQVAELFMKPYVMLPMSMLIYAFIGLINGLIIGAIVKKENPGAF